MYSDQAFDREKIGRELELDPKVAPFACSAESGRRESNPLGSAWKAGARPLSITRMDPQIVEDRDTEVTCFRGQRPTILGSPRRGSHPQPPTYRVGALLLELQGHSGRCSTD